MTWWRHVVGRERVANRRRRDLVRATTRLPIETKTAMLEAIQSETLIAGAYTDRSGRMCPQLAAHRRGARSNALEFACAWDAFTQAKRPRPATERELEILKAVLQESLAGAAHGSPLDASASAEPHLQEA